MDITQPAAVAPEKGSPEHDAAMAAKYDAHQAGVGSDLTGDIPPAAPLVPPVEAPKFAGKFNTAEDLEKAYKALEAKLGGPKSIEATPTPPSDPEAPVAPPSEAKAVVEAAGLDFDALSKEFADNQGLSDDSYAKMEKAGIPRSVVDSYVKGQQLIGDSYAAKAYAVVGSADDYKAMIDWAQAAMTPAQLAAYDKSVMSMDEDSMVLSVEGMKSRYEAAVGKTPKLIQGNQNQTSQLGFKSIREQVNATKDPRYKSDPAYRQSVMQRIAVSNY